MKKSNKRTKVYALKTGHKIKYFGITINPSRRASEHKRSGKRFLLMKILSSHNKRSNAEKTERSKIQTYQRQHGGKPPRYNKDHTYPSKKNRNRK